MGKDNSYSKIFRKYLNISFLLFIVWEFLQSSFYDNSGITIFKLIYYRVHCTIGDIMILSFCIFIWGILKRKNNWIKKPSKIDYLGVTVLGLCYTIFSEVRNVFIVKSWAYSSSMPLIPFVNIGLIPIIQWITLPTIIIYLSIGSKKYK